MSRSRRHTPITGITTAASEKKDKQTANRKLRRKTKVAIENGEEILPVLDDVLTPWQMGKDGKQYLGDRHPDLMRK